MAKAKAQFKRTTKATKVPGAMDPALIKPVRLVPPVKGSFVVTGKLTQDDPSVPPAT